MKLSTRIECVGCKGSTLISFKKPGFLEKVTVHFECTDCKSLVLAILSRPKKRDLEKPFATHIAQKIMSASPLLRQIWAEDAAERNTHGQETATAHS